MDNESLRNNFKINRAKIINNEENLQYLLKYTNQMKYVTNANESDNSDLSNIILLVIEKDQVMLKNHLKKRVHH